MTASPRPTPGHKLTSYVYSVTVTCECGWRSCGWSGKGARGSALAEWKSHKDKCTAA